MAKAAGSCLCKKRSFLPVIDGFTATPEGEGKSVSVKSVFLPLNSVDLVRDAIYITHCGQKMLLLCREVKGKFIKVFSYASSVNKMWYEVSNKNAREMVLPITPVAECQVDYDAIDMVVSPDETFCIVLCQYGQKDFLVLYRIDICSKYVEFQKLNKLDCKYPVIKDLMIFTSNTSFLSILWPIWTIMDIVQDSLKHRKMFHLPQLSDRVIRTITSAVYTKFHSIIFVTSDLLLFEYDLTTDKLMKHRTLGDHGVINCCTIRKFTLYGREGEFFSVLSDNEQTVYVLQQKNKGSIQLLLQYQVPSNMDERNDRPFGIGSFDVHSTSGECFVPLLRDSRTIAVACFNPLNHSHQDYFIQLSTDSIVIKKIVSWSGRQVLCIGYDFSQKCFVICAWNMPCEFRLRSILKNVIVENFSSDEVSSFDVPTNLKKYIISF